MDSISHKGVTMSQIEKNLTDDINALQARINQYCAAWTTQAGEPDWGTIEQLYADEDLMHYDAVTPHSFANVAGMKEAFAGMKQGLRLIALELKARKGLNVFRRGDLVWTTVLQNIVAKTEDGNELRFVQRQTGIWEERDGNWVMVHEHLSAPSSLQKSQ
jgi:ketosteroid isomerase-like protein